MKSKCEATNHHGRIKLSLDWCWRHFWRPPSPCVDTMPLADTHQVLKASAYVFFSFPQKTPSTSPSLPTLQCCWKTLFNPSKQIAIPRARSPNFPQIPDAEQNPSRAPNTLSSKIQTFSRPSKHPPSQPRSLNPQPQFSKVTPPLPCPQDSSSPPIPR